MKRKNSEYRSAEIQEIIAREPAWIIRSGMSLFLGLLLLLLIISWLVKYPDVIKGEMVVTTGIPPERVMALADGLIERVEYKNGDNVEKGDVILTLSTSTNQNALAFLRQTCKKISTQIGQGQEKINTRLLDDIVDLRFGELQSKVSALQESIFMFNEDLEKKNEKYLIQNKLKEIENTVGVIQIAKGQIENAGERFKAKKDNYSMNKSLYEDSVISREEFNNSKMSYLQTKDDLYMLKKAKIEQETKLLNLKKEHVRLKDGIQQKTKEHKEKVLLIISEIENTINEWERTFVIKAPFSGKVNFLMDMDKTIFLKTGEPIATIVPKNKNYESKIYVNENGYGKVEIGQKVRMSVYSYDSKEYGYLKGRVLEKDILPNSEGFFVVKVALEKGLQTNYGRMLKYGPEMRGKADIITKELRISERIFYSLREAFKP